MAGAGGGSQRQWAMPRSLEGTRDFVRGATRVRNARLDCALRLGVGNSERLDFEIRPT
jgi:hypothetical protein